MSTSSNEELYHDEEVEEQFERLYPATNQISFKQKILDWSIKNITSINTKIYVKDIIEIFVNIDGVQIYKNSKQQFWPILIMLHDKKYIVKPQVVAIYHGKSKPKSPTEFLNKFIEELLNLMTNKITLTDK